MLCLVPYLFKERRVVRMSKPMEATAFFVSPGGERFARRKKNVVRMITTYATVRLNDGRNLRLRFEGDKIYLQDVLHADQLWFLPSMPNDNWGRIKKDVADGKRTISFEVTAKGTHLVGTARNEQIYGKLALARGAELEVHMHIQGGAFDQPRDPAAGFRNVKATLGTVNRMRFSRQ